MNNITSYLVAMKNTSFSEEPFQPVDGLVLSQLSYLRFDTFFPADRKMLSEFPSMMHTLTVGTLREYIDRKELYAGLLRATAFRKFLIAFTECRRFCDMQIKYLVSETDSVTEKQFCAFTCFPGDGTAHITYRGTDSTIVGWKEDFNMAFVSPVPSQEEACTYLSLVAGLTPLPLRVSGHSKGGNLAVYAAMQASPDVQNRMIRIFSYDGPGFRDEVFILPEFQRIRDKIMKFIPQSSIVGMILQHQEPGIVIESRQLGLLQHDPFTWVVKEDDFVYISDIQDAALLMDDTLNDWLSRMSDSEREIFVDTLFGVLNSSGAETLQELIGKFKNIQTTISAAIGVEKETRDVVFKLIFDLLSSITKNYRKYRLERFESLLPMHHPDREHKQT